MRVPSHIRDGKAVESITLTEGAEGVADDITVEVKVTQPSGGPLPANLPPLVAYVATAADGLVLEVPDGGVAAGSRGTVTALLTDESVVVLTPDDNGYVDVTITQSGADTLHLIVVDPSDGSIVASAALVFAA